MGEEDLQKVLAGCLKNDRKDQKILYKTFYAFAMGICLRYAVNKYEASEIMNQGFTKFTPNWSNLIMPNLLKPGSAAS